MPVGFWLDDHRAQLVPLARGAETGLGNDEILELIEDHIGQLAAHLAAAVPGVGDPTPAQLAEALRVAEANLPPGHPIRLGLALNYAVSHYEILKNQKKASEIAKKALDEAVSKLDQLDEASYKISVLVMQLLRDNLAKWG